jgi:hypothetical protein
VPRRGILGSPDSGSRIHPPLRATRMTSKALHAAWAEVYILWWWMDM